MSRTAPLRKIVKQDPVKFHPDSAFSIPRDWLECGHILPVAHDIYGERYPERRRCHKCEKGKERQWDPEEEK